MDIQFLKDNNLLLFEAISGSRAYGTDLPTSDTDLRGVFYLPKNEFYGLNNIPQISDSTNDEVYYELGRFIELLYKNNPNMLELLAMPQDCIQYKHPLFERIKKDIFLSKLCKNTFAGYAISQVRKARGLNKKIVNPMSKTRKSILDFCYVIKAHGSMPLKKWLENNGYQQERCGLVNIANFKGVYAIFYDEKGDLNFKGIMNKPTANEVHLTSIPKGMEKVGLLSFNKDGYQTYCKDYREYWSWVEKRNDVRYENTISHGKNYDAKNMMHTIRLLDMAEEIAVEKQIHVRRPNRDFLLKIRSGALEYDELLQMAEKKIERIEQVYAVSDLQEKPDKNTVQKLLVELREELY